MDGADLQKGETGLDLAGVGQRLASYLVDVIVLSVIYIALLFLLRVDIGGEVVRTVGLGENFNPVYLLVAAIGIGYYTYFFGKGETPGMKLVEIKLIRADGVEPVGYGKGFLRWVGMEVSGIALLLGFIWILIDKKKQGWHDKIAGTYVVRA